MSANDPVVERLNRSRLSDEHQRNCCWGAFVRTVGPEPVRHCSCNGGTATKQLATVPGDEWYEMTEHHVYRIDGDTPGVFHHRAVWSPHRCEPALAGATR